MKTHNSRDRRRGVSTIELAFSLLVLIPLLLGTGVTGVNMIKTLQVIQLARDVGHMYARNVDFSQPGNKTIAQKVSGDIGLSTTNGSGNAVVILSTLTYVDKNQCATLGLVDINGVPTSACTNYRNWVFTQRLTIGNAAVRSSNMGSPLTSGPTGVTVNPTTGKISATDFTTKAGARATFTGVNPYSTASGSAQGLPSGQFLYIAEAAAMGMNMPPFVSGAVAYSWGLF